MIGIVTKPLISIVIANYNKKLFIEDTLISLINQTYKNIEIIIVDDGSTDNSSTIIKKYSLRDSRLRVFLCNHLGKVAAFNYGISMSKGDYIKIWSSDDLLFNHAIEDMVKEIKNYHTIIHNMDVVSQNLELLMPSFINFNLPDPTLINVINGRSYPSGCYLFKRETIEQIFPLPMNIPYEDWYIYAMLLKNRCMVKYYGESLGLYRQVANSAYGGIFSKDPSILLYRNMRDQKMLVVFRESFSTEYHDDIDREILKKKLLSFGTFFTILSSQLTIRQKMVILIKKYCSPVYRIYLIVRLKINMCKKSKTHSEMALAEQIKQLNDYKSKIAISDIAK
jgi:glycosyltransferase involved in cell wall biosynthesis